MIIGLTGGIGSGKSTVAKMFNEFSTVAIYIADIEAKQLMNTSKVIKENLIKSFGEDVFKNAVLNKLKQVAETSETANELREKVLIEYTKALPPTETGISFIKNEVRKLL